MNGPDDEFEDFLRRRRPLFERVDDSLEPPAELDRLVLRQAREAIETRPSQRIFRAPRWSLPVGLAATVLLAFTVIVNTSQQSAAPGSEVRVQNVAREVPAAESISADRQLAESAPQRRDDGALFVDVIEAEADTGNEPASLARGASAPVDKLAKREALPQRAAKTDERPAAPAAVVASGDAAMRSRAESPAEARVLADSTSMSRELANAAPAAATPAPTPDYRRDARTWLAEIERLRAAGETARADAELEEFRRQHRAFATSPDR